MVIMLVVNMIVVVLNTVEKVKANRRKAKLIKIGEQRLKILKLT